MLLYGGESEAGERTNRNIVSAVGVDIKSALPEAVL